MLNLLRVSKKKGLITISIGLLAIVVTAFVLLLPKEKEEKTISQINLKQQNNYNAVATVNGTSWYYDLDKDGNAINVHYKEGKLGENVIIPENLDGHIVVKIYNSEDSSKSIFGDKKSSIKTVVIPKGVTSIEGEAFCGCSSLTSINIPEGVTSIGGSAFYKCSSLTNINIPEGVTSIHYDTFNGCSSLTSINIPEGVTSIGKGAFYGCSSLTSINIPEGVTSIEDFVFYECKVTLAVANNGMNIPEIELPEIVRRSQVEGDILYSDQKLTLNNCEISEDGNKLKIKNGNKATLKVNSGVLEELEIEIVPSGTITYSNTYWTRNNIVAILHIAEGESIKENDGGNIHTFTENGEFTFKYVDTNNEEKEVVAKVENIDKQAPIIKSVEGNQTEWTKENVTIKINAEDNLSGLAYNAYSFDGGETWQKENEKTYTENTSNIVIKVMDNAGNVIEYESISITKIDKGAPIITGVKGNPTEWTKENVTIKINAEDNLSGLAEQAYSFDGGETWQKENEKTYTENTSNIVIKVRDDVGNVAEYEPISITKIIKLTEIKVTNEPTRTSYVAGQNFETEGMVVTASYNDGTSKAVTNYTVTDGNSLTAGKTSVTISYTENGITKTVTQNITVVAKALTGIAVTKAPTRTSYVAGQNFETEGMVVTASYNDGTSKAVTNYTVTDGNSLTAGKTSVTISYTENGVTKTAKQAITVVEKEKLEIEVKTYQEVKENEINYIEKIMPNTSIEALRRNIETNGTIEIYKNNKKISDDNKLIATGMEIVIKLEDQEKRYTAVVIGDLSGDGKISIGDLLKLARYEAKIDTNLTGAYLRASDVVGKGKYGGISNLIKVSRIIAGMDNL